jgi:predicted enzyme related to lactoylglutathione lyase
MSTRLVHLVIDAVDPPAQAAFWAAALGWEVTADDPDEAVVEPEGFDYPGIAALPLVFVPVTEPKVGKNRVHLDLASASLDDQAATVRRLRDLGAVSADVGQGGEAPWVVLADPEGNELCVLDPRSDYRGTGPVAAVVIDCADPPGLASFWAEAAGWRAVEHRQRDGLVALRSVSGAGPFLELLRVPGAKTGKNRIHPDVAPFPGGDNLDEAERLRKVGATPADVGQAANVPWVVLADPEGNEFCVLTPR